MKLIDFKQLAPCKGITYSRDHLRRKCAAGEFPEPIPVSVRRIAWVEAEVDAWLARRAASRKTSPRYAMSGELDCGPLDSQQSHLVTGDDSGTLNEIRPRR